MTTWFLISVISIPSWSVWNLFQEIIWMKGEKSWTSFFFFIYAGCPGQLTRTTTISHGPLDILQAQEQVRHRGGDRHAHRESNPEQERNKSHNWPQQLGPRVLFLYCQILTCLGELVLWYKQHWKVTYKS